MSEFYFPVKRRKLLKTLKKLGLSIIGGGKHDRAACLKNGGTTTVPRHAEIKREIVDSIAKFLLDKEYDREQLIKLLR